MSSHPFVSSTPFYLFPVLEVSMAFITPTPFLDCITLQPNQKDARFFFLPLPPWSIAMATIESKLEELKVWQPRETVAMATTGVEVGRRRLR